MVNWRALIRDLVILFGLSLAGGLLVGLSATGDKVSAAAVAISNIITMTVGFTISACLVKTRRLRHLASVGLAVWFISAFNFVFPDFTVVEWLLGAAVITFSLLVGLGVSFVLISEPKKAPEPHEDILNTVPSVSAEKILLPCQDRRGTEEYGTDARKVADSKWE